MSHTILYRTAFLKLKGGTVIPIGEAGDNNVYDYDGKRRARSFSTGWTFLQDKLSFSQEEIKQSVQKVVNKYISEYAFQKKSWEDTTYSAKGVQEQLDYFMGLSLYGKTCTNTTANDFMNWFIKGAEKAVSVEQMAKATEIMLRCTNSNEQKTFRITDEETLVSLYNEHKAKGDEVLVLYPYGIGELTYKTLFPAKAKNKIHHETAFIVRAGTLTKYYVKAVSRRGSITFSDERYAHRYASRDSAEKVVRKINIANDSRFTEPTIIEIQNT